MLKIFNKNQQIIHQYETIDVDHPIELHIQCQQLLDIYEDNHSLCFFYGFLDAEKDSTITVANHINKVLSAKPEDNLLQLIGSFIVLN